MITVYFKALSNEITLTDWSKPQHAIMSVVAAMVHTGHYILSQLPVVMMS
jgi:hypothetical protein